MREIMNKETTQILDYINKSGHYLDKIGELRLIHNNLKDFTFKINYLIMSIVNEEERFFNMSRKNIDLQEIANKFF